MMCRFSIGLTIFAVVAITGGSAVADPPVAGYLFPAGMQRGKSVDIVIGGLNLTRSCNVETAGPGGVRFPNTVAPVVVPWFEGPILPLPDSQRQEDYPRGYGARIMALPTAPVGDRRVFLRTSQGVTLPLTFVIGDDPEVIEKERDDDTPPVPVSAPVTVNGRIFPRQDVDEWEVTLSPGATLIAAIDADRLGSPLVARLQLLDANDRIVAEEVAAPGRDPRIRWNVTSAGKYRIRVSDIKADGGPGYVYRLNIRTEPVIDRVFPLGAKRGTNVDFRPIGTDRVIRIAVPHDAPANWTPPEFGPAGIGANLDVDDLTEVVESTDADPVRGNHLPIPAIGNGRIDVSGEVDRWSVSARKGETIHAELRARRIGSRMLGLLRAVDPAGKELAAAESGGPDVDPVVRFTAPADGLYFIEVREMFRTRGGTDYAYRLRVQRPTPDFDLRFTLPALTVVRGAQTPLRIQARRHGGFNGPIQIALDGLPPGVTPPPAVVIAANQNQVDVPLKADVTARVTLAQVKVRGAGLVSLLPFSAMPAALNRTAVWADDPTIDVVRTAVAVPTPFKIAGDYELKLIPRGTVYTRSYRIERNGFTGPIEIGPADRQARHLQGVTGPTFLVPADKSAFDYPITLPPWMETGRTCRVCVMGTAVVRDPDGTEHMVTYSSREQNDQIIAVVEPERLGIRLNREGVAAKPGERATIGVEVLRGEGVRGNCLVELVLPAGTSGASLRAIDIKADASTAEVVIQFDRDLKDLPTTAILRATVRVDGKPVTAESKFEMVHPR